MTSLRAIVFPTDYENRTKTMLLSLPASLAASLSPSHLHLISPTPSSTLCLTLNATFALKSVASSSTMIITKKSDEKEEIVETVGSTLELDEVAPHCAPLRRFLLETSFTSTQDDQEIAHLATLPVVLYSLAVSPVQTIIAAMVAGAFVHHDGAAPVPAAPATRSPVQLNDLADLATSSTVATHGALRTLAPALRLQIGQLVAALLESGTIAHGGDDAWTDVPTDDLLSALVSDDHDDHLFDRNAARHALRLLSLPPLQPDLLLGMYAAEGAGPPPAGLPTRAIDDARTVGLDRAAVRARLPALCAGADLWPDLPPTITLRRDTLARWQAESMLAATSGPTDWDTFRAAWEEAVPDGVRVSVDLLAGLAFLADSTDPAAGDADTASHALAGGKRRRVRTILCPLDRDNLPPTLAARFARLFSYKAAWTAAALTPFLADAVVPGSSVDQILVSHTRSAPGPAGERLYMAR